MSDLPEATQPERSPDQTHLPTVQSGHCFHSWATPGLCQSAALADPQHGDSQGRCQPHCPAGFMQEVPWKTRSPG